MTAETQEAEDLSAPRRPAQETWREVMDLKLRIVEMAGDVRKIASLADDHTKLELRVRALEVAQATSHQRNATATYIWATIGPSLVTLAVLLWTVFLKK